MKFLFLPRFRDRHRQIVALIVEKKLMLIGAGICMLTYSGSTAALAFFLKDILDDIFIAKDAAMLQVLLPLVFGIFVVRGLAVFGQAFFMGYVGLHIVMQLRNMLYRCITGLSLSFFQKEKTGVLMSRITNDVNIIRTMVSTAVTDLITNICTIICLMGVVIYRDWQLAILGLGVLAFAIYPVVYFGRRSRKHSTKFQQSMGVLNAFIQETFIGAKIVKSFCRESTANETFVAINRRVFKSQIRQLLASARTSPVMEILTGIGVVIVIWLGFSKMVSGEATTGSFMSFLTALLLIYNPARKIAKLNAQVQAGLAAVDRVFDVMEQPIEVKETESPRTLSARQHSVTFRHVFFRYPESEANVLQDIKLHVNPGEIIGLAGMSGGGKTTLVNLIPRFFDVSSGELLIDGINIKEFSLYSLRSRVGIVTQEPILFNTTIAENIRYGRPDASDEEVERAARDAYAYDFIMRFPQQLETPIGEMGNRLSGGEKQRLCIARALLKNAPILILDEATSALDAEAESIVQKAMRNLMQGRTTFVIAHRLSTIQFADRIIVIAGGKIVEEGDQKTLLARKGEYYKLVTMQNTQTGDWL